MASSTDATNPPIVSQVKFLGPAQKKYDSFEELSKDFFDTYWPQRNNCENPTCLFIPPIFYYAHPDAGNNRFQEANTRIGEIKAKNPGTESKHPDFRLVIDRGTDEAEHIIYNALYQLASEGTQAPFMVVRNIDFGKLKNKLALLFPHLQWKDLNRSLCQCFDDQLLALFPDEERQNMRSYQEKFQNSLVVILNDFDDAKFKVAASACIFDIFGDSIDSKIPQKCIEAITKRFREYCFREYDYVLIGPKIGIIVLEVKHSHFKEIDQATATKTRSLPSQYEHAVVQLNSSDAFVHLLQECAKINDANILEPQKILFTPNLERHRFSAWLQALDPINAAKVREKLTKAGKIISWFHEDNANDLAGSSRCPLYDNLSGILQNGRAMSTAVFESLASIMSGLFCVAIIGQNHTPGTTVSLTQSHVSEKKAIERESTRIHAQDPGELLNKDAAETSSSKRQKSLESILDASAVIRQFFKAIILTPDQQKALQGQKRQLVFGAAGTGKTIVMQQRVQELLSRNRKVLVYAPSNYVKTYAALVADRDGDQYSVSSWEKMANHLFEFGSEICGACNHDEYEKWFSKLCKVLESVGENDLDKLGSHKAIISLRRLRTYKYDDLLVDDAFDAQEPDTKSSKSRERILAVFTLLALFGYMHRDKGLWIALDPYAGYLSELEQCGNCETVVGSLLNCGQYYDSRFSDGGDLFSAANLRLSMRCPESISDVAYQWLTKKPYTSAFPVLFSLLPSVGHKVQGMHKVAFNGHRTTRKEALELIWEKVKIEFEQLLEQAMDLEQITVIIDNGRFETREAAIAYDLMPYLTKRLVQMIPQDAAPSGG